MSLAPYTAMCSVPEVVAVPFRFQAAAAGGAEPDFQFPAGVVKNVTRDGSAGLYTVTFFEKYPSFLGLVGTVLPATPVNDQLVKCSVSSYDATAGTLQITVVDSGTAAAADVADNDWVFCVAYFCRRTALAKVGPVPA